MKKGTGEIFPYRLALFFLLLFAAANLSGIRQLWGFNFLKFLPSYWTYLSLAVAVILVLPTVSGKIASASGSFSQALVADKARRIKFVIVCSLLLLPLFLYFSSATTLLGDGTLRKNQIYKDQVWLSTEILDFFTHAVLSKYIFRLLDLNVSQCYHVVSALCGVVFVNGIFRLAYYLNPHQVLIPFLLMLSSGMTVLFFGYVESYSILAALLPYLMLCGLKVIDGRSGTIGFIAWYLIAALVHSLSVFLFSGALLFILLVRHGENAPREKRVSRYLAAAALVALAVAYVGRAAGIGDISRYLLALLAQEDYRQGIFTANHWLNLLNWLFLSALPFLFLSPFIVKKRAPNPALSRRSLFALWMIIPSLLFMFFFVPQLGGPRDWDLFSLPAFLLVPSALIIYFARYRRSLPHQIIPIIFISVCTTASFAAVNSDTVKATDRFVEIIEVSQFKDLVKEYATLVSLAENRPEIAERRLEYALEVWEQPPYTKGDSVSALAKIGNIYIERGDSARALHYLRRALSVDTTDLNSHIYLIRFHDRFGTREDLLTMAKTLERRFPHKALGLMNAGIILQRLGEVGRGGEDLERAFYLDSTNYDVLLNYGTLQIQKENYTRSIQILLRVLKVNPESFLANYYISWANANLGNRLEAEKYLLRAELLAEDLADKQMIEDLKGKLGRLK